MTAQFKAPTPFAISKIKLFPKGCSVEVQVRNPKAKIYYTLDGSEPNELSALYAAPVNLNESATIKAVAYADGMEKSDVMIAEATKADYWPGLKVNPGKKGISYVFYEGKMRKTTDMLNMTPVRTGICETYSIRELNAPEEHYGIIFKAYLKLDKPDVYWFHVTSDDGPVLWIDGKEVVPNDGSHAGTHTIGSVALGSGFHEVELRYFQDTQGKGLMFGLAGGGHNSWGAPAKLSYVK